MESRETRLKRLKMRSWRRGMKEMDLILGQFADNHLASLSASELDAHEALMAETDTDLYQWISGQLPAPKEFQSSIDLILSKSKT